MEEVYSALLLHSAGQPINEENIKKILQSIGLTVDEAKIEALVASLEGVNIDEVMKQAVVAAPAPKEEKKEEKKEKEEEGKKAEEAAAGLSALFG
jgi:large subunit ribosomal protein L12